MISMCQNDEPLHFSHYFHGKIHQFRVLWNRTIRTLFCPEHYFVLYCFSLLFILSSVFYFPSISSSLITLIHFLVLVLEKRKWKLVVLLLHTSFSLLPFIFLSLIVFVWILTFDQKLVRMDPW